MSGPKPCKLASSSGKQMSGATMQIPCDPHTKVLIRGSGPNFMALLTVNTELALTDAGNSVLTASMFHRLAPNFGFCTCVIHVTRHSMAFYSLRLAQKFGACTYKLGIMIVRAEFGG